jgi:tRNA pseudouridine55 synthase
MIPLPPLDEIQSGAVLLVHKPLDWTSFDVVKKIRMLFQVKKVGHAGTLDPKATGLLIVCTGNKTKGIEQFIGLEKEYEGVMELGAITPSGDTETEISERRGLVFVTEEKIRKVCQEFIGAIEQIPPMHSAIKVKGQPLYKHARQGKVVERTPRKANIVAFDIRNIVLPDVAFRVVCSKGTYIRSLVYDVGERLGCGAYLKALTRTRIGTFRLDDAVNISSLESLALVTHRFAPVHEGSL